MLVFFPHCRELTGKLSLQRLLRTFRSQQRYLEVSPRLNDEFGTVFEAIQIILEPVLDVKLRQRQNHSVDHGSTNILYTPKKHAICVTFPLEKIVFYASNGFENFLNVCFGWKTTRNIFTTCMYDEKEGL